MDISSDITSTIVSIRNDPNLFNTKSIPPAVTLVSPEEYKPEKLQVQNEVLKEEEEEAE